MQRGSLRNIQRFAALLFAVLYLASLLTMRYGLLLAIVLIAIVLVNTLRTEDMEQLSKDNVTSLASCASKPRYRDPLLNANIRRAQLTAPQPQRAAIRRVPYLSDRADCKPAVFPHPPRASPRRVQSGCNFWSGHTPPTRASPYFAV